MKTKQNKKKRDDNDDGVHTRTQTKKDGDTASPIGQKKKILSIVH